MSLPIERDERRWRALHERWRTALNRDMNAPSYREEWRVEQCFSCHHFFPLAGEMGNDYGACTNPLSEFDRRVMFEHDGCAAHELAAEYR